MVSPGVNEEEEEEVRLQHSGSGVHKTGVGDVALFPEVLGWPKRPRSFFHKIKDTSFIKVIFTNNFIDLSILSMPALSHVVER